MYFLVLFFFLIFCLPGKKSDILLTFLVLLLSFYVFQERKNVLRLSFLVLLWHILSSRKKTKTKKAVILLYFLIILLSCSDFQKKKNCCFIVLTSFILIFYLPRKKNCSFIVLSCIFISTFCLPEKKTVILLPSLVLLLSSSVFHKNKLYFYFPFSSFKFSHSLPDRTAIPP